MRQAAYEVLANLKGELTGQVWRTGNVRTAFENVVVEAKLDGLLPRPSGTASRPGS